jgi:fumarate reductase subunit C
MSATTPANPPRVFSTRTLAARPPDGFWTKHPRYFWYVLFAATAIPLAIAAVIVLVALSALGGGAQSWETFLNVLASPPMVLLDLLLLVGILYFSLRFLIVGVKIPAVKLGPVPAFPPVVYLVAHLGGLAALSLVVLVLFSGAIL